MQVTCKTNPKGKYALTAGREYRVVERTRSGPGKNERYHVQNDNGVVQAYGTNLFEVKRGTVGNFPWTATTGTAEAASTSSRTRRTRPAPAPTPPPEPNLTIQETIALFTWEDETLVVNGSDEVATVEMEESPASCGIMNVENLDSVIRNVYRTLADNPRVNVSEAGLLTSVYAHLFSSMVETLNTYEETRAAMYLLTTNTTNSTTNALALNSAVEALNAVAASTHNLVNPNSGNNISVWIMTA